MTRSKLLAGAAALALLVAAPSASFAFGRGGGGGGHMGGGGGHMGGGGGMHMGGGGGMHMGGAPMGGARFAGAPGARFAGAGPVGRVGGGPGWTGGHAAWNNGGWHGGYRRHGFYPGVVAGAVIGGAVADSYAYYDSPDYGYGQDYYDNGYGDGGDVAVVQGGGGDASYCAQRYRSYDPASGTYLGYDGQRHPCP
jgi:hypothetical protein